MNRLWCPWKAPWLTCYFSIKKKKQQTTTETLLVNLAKQKIIHVIKSIFLRKTFFIHSTEYIKYLMSACSPWKIFLILMSKGWMALSKPMQLEMRKDWYPNKSAGWNFGYELWVFMNWFSSKGKVTGSLNIQAAVAKLPFVHSCSHFGRHRSYIFKVMLELEKCWVSINDCLSLDQTNKNVVRTAGES